MSQAESADLIGQQMGHHPEDVSESKTKAAEAISELKHKHKPDFSVGVVFLGDTRAEYSGIEQEEGHNEPVHRTSLFISPSILFFYENEIL